MVIVAYIILGEVKAVHSIFSFLRVVVCVVIIVLFLKMQQNVSDAFRGEGACIPTW